MGGACGVVFGVVKATVDRQSGTGTAMHITRCVRSALGFGFVGAVGGVVWPVSLPYLGMYIGNEVVKYRDNNKSRT